MNQLEVGAIGNAIEIDEGGDAGNRRTAEIERKGPGIVVVDHLLARMRQAADGSARVPHAFPLQVKVAVGGFFSTFDIGRGVGRRRKASSQLAVAGAELERPELVASCQQVEAKIRLADPLRVVDIVETFVIDRAKTQAPVEIALLARDAKIGILDIRTGVIADGYRVARADILGGVTCNNIDRRQERVGAVGDRIGSANDLDAFDVLDQQRQVRPGDPAERGNKNRATVDQHLHVAREFLPQALIRNRRCVSAVVAHYHARNQPEQVGNFAHPGRLDHLPVDDTDAGGRFEQRLGHPRYGQDQRRFGEKILFHRGLCVGR